jgi:hypothetical protein
VASWVEGELGALEAGERGMDVGQHCTKLWHRAIHSGKSKNFVAAYVSLVILGADRDGINDLAPAVGRKRATCRQTRAKMTH